MIIQRYVGLTKHLAQVCCRRLLFVLPCLHPNTEATSYSERVPPELVGEVILLGVVVPVVLPHVHCGVLNTLCLSIWERASSSTGLCVHCACLHNRPLGYKLWEGVWYSTSQKPFKIAQNPIDRNETWWLLPSAGNSSNSSSSSRSPRSTLAAFSFSVAILYFFWNVVEVIFCRNVFLGSERGSSGSHKVTKIRPFRWKFNLFFHQLLDKLGQHTSVINIVWRWRNAA